MKFQDIPAASEIQAARAEHVRKTYEKNIEDLKKAVAKGIESDIIQNKKPCAYIKVGVPNPEQGLGWMTIGCCAKKEVVFEVGRELIPKGYKVYYMTHMDESNSGFFMVISIEELVAEKYGWFGRNIFGREQILEEVK